MTSFLVSDEAQAQVDAWPKASQQRFVECLEDAASELQREMIQRSVVAGHTPAEIHAFADEIRTLTDDEVFEKCTLGDTDRQFTVEQMLRAESDPLFAFELNGGELSPDESAHLPMSTPSDSGNFHPVLRPLDKAYVKNAQMFDAASRGAMPRAVLPPPPKELNATSGQTSGRMGSLFEETANDGTRSLGITWREFDLDVATGMKTEDAIPAAAKALLDGIPLAANIGSRPGDHRRSIIILQINTSGKSRAWQLYEPFSGEIVWAHESDLLTRNELPFIDKANRRLTRISLPTYRSGQW